MKNEVLMKLSHKFIFFVYQIKLTYLKSILQSRLCLLPSNCIRFRGRIMVWDEVGSRVKERVGLRDKARALIGIVCLV